MKEFWNQRYATSEYLYGIEPNMFLKEQLAQIDEKGSILFPAEGEGRNAVYAATLGWQVTAFDNSNEGYKKAMRLAKQKHVSINYEVNSFQDFQPIKDLFDCVVLIYAHMPPGLRQIFHHSVLRWLKPGGLIILEGFSKNQLGRSSGGPSNIDMLFSAELLNADFNQLSNFQITEEEVVLEEGIGHKGKASVVRLKGIK